MRVRRSAWATEQTTDDHAPVLASRLDPTWLPSKTSPYFFFSFFFFFLESRVADMRWKKERKRERANR